MIKRLTNPAAGKESGPAKVLWLRMRFPQALFIVLICGLVILSGCGGGSSQPPGNSSGAVSGNWQFTMAPPPDNSFQGGIQGGFLVQSKGAVSGQLAYSITLPSQPGTFCNSGSASVTGNVNGQNVTITAVAGSQTFALTGTVSSDGSTMMGTYTTTGQGCGNPQSTALAWSAVSVPPLSGAIQGDLHSTNSQVTNLQDQDFAVTGTLTQGPNNGESSATLTGTLNFQNYPCVSTVSVSGQISGNVVSLQLFGINGASLGTIGGTNFPVSFTNTSQGYVLKGTTQVAYTISSKQCGSGDQGNICLALGSSNKACTQPISLSPAFLAFPLQPIGAPASNQAITLTNTDPSGGTVDGLQITFKAAQSDFNLQPNFTEQDNCASSPGTVFSLGSKQSCTITVSFAPQQGCPFQPSPSLCAPFLTANPGIPPTLTSSVVVTTGGAAQSADGDNSFVVPVSGLGESAIQPSTPELDFGSEAAPTPGGQGEQSLPQTVSFTNQGASPVQILPHISNSHCGPPGSPIFFSLPLTDNTVPGLQVVNSVQAASNFLSYVCDFDFVTGQPNFILTGDTCSGILLNPTQSCSLTVTYAPQEEFANGLDDFLELNTNQCAAGSPDCEIDSGRFPIELKANPASPLRMTPSAGLDFGTQLISSPDLYQPLQVKLFNDPNDPNAGTINFTGKVLSGSAFTETDNCIATLAPGATCTFTVSFAPSSAGFAKGSITVTFNGKAPQIISLRGIGQ